MVATVGYNLIEATATPAQSGDDMDSNADERWQVTALPGHCCF